jgi:cell division protein FtsA
MKNEKKIISAIDIGTSKICTIIANYDKNNLIEILGIGQSKSIGIKKGIVVNINDTVNAINNAIEKAENQSGEKLDSCIIGISGEHIRGINNTGVIMVQNNNQEIDNQDIQRVLKHAQTITLPLERRILHVLSQDYKVDEQAGIKDPLGMIGNRLETKVHLVTSELAREKNITKCIDQVGLDINDIVLNPLATSYSVLDNNEKDLGIALIDIGAGTTEIIVYTDGGVQHTGIIPIGGNNITLDIAHGVQTTIENAEKLKCNYGIAKEALANPEEIINIKDVNNSEVKNLTQKELASFIEPRMEEILMLAKTEIRKCGQGEVFTFGIKLTGGGALLKNSLDLANNIFFQPVKLGKPNLTGGISENLNNPIYSTAVGLLNYSIYNNKNILEEKISIINIFNSFKKILKEIF